ncbi:OLC1v1013816C1 [Oldenlandia corymbosa var. corymbosa]|uniref:OLC1v1013816C1 n=1 Tax=Oldenlandia corymbosa var. corymbosa TaxID=529605 RepID=A0AAV1DZA4_OLDCO|nr:OLC1v1013816C1 [Oldenlandia corymbosa var. corymbosa]
MSLKNASSPPPCESDKSSCQLEEPKATSISSIFQLDFASTVAALLGLPFPFGSIGRVDPELYELVAASRESKFIAMNKQNDDSDAWMENYVNVLCINSWQVKRYIDAYSASSAIGFSGKDLVYISDLYANAQELWSKNIKYPCESNSCFLSSSVLKMQIDRYSNFLSTVAGLARSKWTEFNLRLMTCGFCLMVVSLFVHVYIIKRLDKQFQHHVHFSGDSGISFTAVVAWGVVLIRAFSFLSNSFILEEGKVASFLLATTGMLQLQHALAQKALVLDGLIFVLLVPLLRFGIELGQAKQAVNSLFLKYQPSWTHGILNNSVILTYVVEIVPLVGLVLLACILYRCMLSNAFKGISKFVIAGTIFNYALIVLIWTSDSSLLYLPMVVIEAIKGHLIPRTVYAVTALQLLFLAVMKPYYGDATKHLDKSATITALTMLSSCSSTVILLSGRQGPLVALFSIIAGWCIIQFLRRKQSDSSYVGTSSFYSFPTAQWSLLATSLFFCTGHWCAFDGLRYAAAFIGFDEFNIIWQAALLTLDTFGFSHILPILGLPLVVAFSHPKKRTKEKEDSFSIRLCQVYLMYGLTIAVPATLTILCVAIQRRHLMVWGLFAPKFVFDVAGLILSDFLICLASLYYLT